MELPHDCTNSRTRIFLRQYHRQYNGDQEDVLWIQTNYGLDRFDSHQQTIQSFKEFKDINKMAKSAAGDAYHQKMTVTSIISTGTTKSSERLDVGTVVFENVLQIVVDSSDILWIFSSDGSNQSYAIEKERNEIKLSPRNHLITGEIALGFN